MSDKLHHDAVLFVNYKLPIFRGIIDLVLMKIFYTVNIYFWERKKIDFKLAFDLHSH